MAQPLRLPVLPIRMHRIITTLSICFSLIGILPCSGQEVFFFRDSNNPGYYDTGLAFKNSPSTIEQTGPSGDKIPTSTTAFAGNNSLRLKWNSKPGGDWSALVIAPGWPFQNISTTDTLAFWAYSETGLSKDHWPTIFMEGAPGTTKSRKYSIASYAGDLPAKSWVRIKIPLSVFFKDPTQTAIQFTQIKAIIFGQSLADGLDHTLLIDELGTFKTGPASSALPTPTFLSARGYDRHIELRWPAVATPPLQWRIYRSTNGGKDFSPLRTISGNDTLFIDFHSSAAVDSFTYHVRATNSGGQESDPSPSARAALQPMSDDELLDMVQSYSLRYFWDFAHPVSGLARERNTSGNTVTIGGSGFGIMGLLVGIERGWIARSQGLERLLKIVGFLEKANRFKGVFPHWMDGNTGDVIPFSARDNGGDLVETAFLFQGLLTARAYFDQSSTNEIALRQKITSLWETTDWNWYRQNQNLLYWHWSPNYGFVINHALRGWNETMIAYLLAIASPTYPIAPSIWQTGWANNGSMRNGNQFFGIRLPLGTNLGGPLFFTHYSFLGFDPRNKKDQYADYFQQNLNQSLLNRAYCIANPKKFPGYGENCWGLTASDDPLVGYFAHEPAYALDNGTVAPTGALSAMPYTPEASMAALKYFYREQGQHLWGPMGFYDAFNLQENWTASSYLAIDQGPIIAMIENHRSGLLWNLFMKNPEIQTALDKIGFTATTTPSQEIVRPEQLGFQLYPNPASKQVYLRFTLPEAATASISITNIAGQHLKQILPPTFFQAGSQEILLSLSQFEPGIYFLQLAMGSTQSTQALILQP